MRVTGSRVYTRPAPVPKMPPGLEMLMEGLTRQVLKNNPDDIYEYCANHMLKLLEIRDGRVKNRTLTLNDKISRAQEQIRQRTKERWERYDQLLQADESRFATKSEEDNRTIKTHHVLQDDQVSYNEQNTTNCFDAANIIIESTQLNKEDNNSDSCQNIIESKLLNTDVKENCTSKGDTNETINEINQVVQSRLLNKNSQQAVYKSFDDLGVNKKISKSIKETRHYIDSANIENQECDKESEGILINNDPIEINDSENEMIKSDTLHNSYVNIENHEETARTDDSEKPEICDNFEYNIQSTVVQNNDTVTAENNVTYYYDNNIDADGNNSLQINCNKDFEKENVLSDSEKNTFSTEQSKLLDNDILDDSNIENNKQIVEHSNTKVITSLNSIDTLDTMVIKDDMIDINIAHDNSTMACNENLKENLTIVQKKLELFGEGQLESIDNVVKNHNNIKKNIHESSNMNLETAAITIQKVFRNFLFKSRASTYEEETNDDCNTLEDIINTKEDSQYSVMYANLGKERRPLGITRIDSVLQTVNEEKSLSQSTDDSSTLSSAATIIQAHVRGFLVRNKLGSHKTSTNSLVKSNSPMSPSIENDVELQKTKTPLNIHIVPETNNFLSRDESTVVSMDLSLDGSPPASINLHPLGYDKSERRKLKREDAIQSISPPSNNSGKLSEDVDFIREAEHNDNLTVDNTKVFEDLGKNNLQTEVSEIAFHDSEPDEGLPEINNDNESNSSHTNTVINNNLKRKDSLCTNSDETDVVTPFSITPASTPTLSHTGEFHDVVLPTKVSRGDTSVVRGE